MIGSLGDGAVLVERFGNEPFDVVCLHGWGRSATDFNQVCSGLNAASVYLPGFGTIDPPPARRIAGIAHFIPRNGPTWFTRIT